MTLTTTTNIAMSASSSVKPLFAVPFLAITEIIGKQLGKSNGDTLRSGNSQGNQAQERRLNLYDRAARVLENESVLVLPGYRAVFRFHLLVGRLALQLPILVRNGLSSLRCCSAEESAPGPSASCCTCCRIDGCDSSNAHPFAVFRKSLHQEGAALMKSQDHGLILNDRVFPRSDERACLGGRPALRCVFVAAAKVRRETTKQRDSSRILHGRT